MYSTSDYPAIISSAIKLLPKLSPVFNDVDYELKGVLYSEALFIAACLYEKEINKILESGRARGQSTLLLAKMFPETEIISYEYDQNSIDVSVANSRLSRFSNVKLKFGDSLTELPRTAEYNDVVVIDGPKMFIALRLALKLLSANKAQHVFIHDLHKNEPCRRFIDIFLRESLFSDYKSFAEVSSRLDNQVIDLIPEENRLMGLKTDFGYGFSMGYLPYSPKRYYLFLYYLSFPYDLLMSETNIVYRFLRKIKYSMRFK